MGGADGCRPLPINAGQAMASCRPSRRVVVVVALVFCVAVISLVLRRSGRVSKSGIGYRPRGLGSAS